MIRRGKISEAILEREPVLRPRSAVLAAIIAAVAIAAVPATADAAPHHNHGLTIAATPDPIISGEGVLIYGRLNTVTPGGQKIALYHRVNPASSFTVIGSTKTSSAGFYEFTRAESAVLTNRSWYVRAPGLAGNIHSRTVHERVAAAVSLATPAPPSPSFLTNQAIGFPGEVAPHHAGERILLQEQTGALGGGWTTLSQARIDSASQFSIPDRFNVPGAYDLRALFSGDERNTAAPSDSVTVVVQQKEKPDFTIYSTSPIIDEGSSATIAGVLRAPATVTPDPSVNVTLWGRQHEQAYSPIASTVTAVDGSYSFAVSPVHTEEYQVRTTSVSARASAQLYEGVRDALTIETGSMTSAVGQSVTFTGTVTPDKAGHVIELQRLGRDGLFHTVDAGSVNAGSAYEFAWTFGTSGTETFRAHIAGGPDNVGGYSPAVAIAVSLPLVSRLPPGS